MLGIRDVFLQDHIIVVVHIVDANDGSTLERGSCHGPVPWQALERGSCLGTGTWQRR